MHREDVAIIRLVLSLNTPDFLNTYHALVLD